MQKFLEEASRPVRWHWANAITTSFADSLIDFALVLLVLKTTGSLSLMALVSIVITLPTILFGLISAVWVDRWHPVKVVSISQLCRAVVVLMFLVADRIETIWLVFVIAFLQSVIGTFDDPARGKLVRAITTDQTRLSVNSLTQTGKMLAGIAGTSLAGLIVAAESESFGIVFTLASLSFAAAGLMVSRIKLPESIVETETNDSTSSGRFLAEFKEGIAAIRTSQTHVALLIVIGAATIGASAATVLLTPLMVNELNISPAWFGAVGASQTVGAILISLAIGMLGARVNTRVLATASLIATGVTICLIGSASSLIYLLIAMLLVGLAITPVSSSVSTIFQSATEERVLGRVAAVFNTVTQPFSIVGMAGAGILADLIGIREVFWIAGGACIVAGILASVLLGRRSATLIESSAKED